MFSISTVSNKLVTSIASHMIPKLLKTRQDEVKQMRKELGRFWSVSEQVGAEMQ